MFFRGNETIQIVRRAAAVKDDFGNPTYTTTTTVIRNCAIGVDGTGEPIADDRNAIDAKLSVYLPAGTEIQSGDLFIVRGTKFVKDGDPEIWVSPFDNWELPVIVKLRKRNG